jgi:O-antigen ligase
MRIVIGLFALAAVIAVLAALFPVLFRRPALWLVGLCAVLPVGLHVAGFGLRLVQLAVIVVVAGIAFGRMVSGRPPLGWSTLLWGPILIATIALLGTPGGIDPSFASKEDVSLFLGVLLMSAIVGAVRGTDDLQLILLAFMAAADVVCLGAVVGAGTATVQFGGAVVTNRAHGIFSSPNDLGSFAAAAFSVALAVGLTGQARSVKIFAWLSAGIAGLAVALSLSRGAVIGVTFAIVGLIVLLPRQRWRLIAGVIAVLCCVLLASGLHRGPSSVQTFGTRLTSLLGGDENPNDRRSAAWQEAIREIEARPLLGYGPNGFPEASASSTRLGGGGTDFPNVSRPVGIDHAHNVPLTVAAELGLVAAAALMLFSVALAYRLWITIRRLTVSRAGALIACAAALLSFVGHGLVDYTLRDSLILVPLYLIAGCSIAATSFVPCGREQDPSSEPGLDMATAFEGG